MRWLEDRGRLKSAGTTAAGLRGCEDQINVLITEFNSPFHIHLDATEIIRFSLDRNEKVPLFQVSLDRISESQQSSH